jgi:proline racemase
MRSARLLHCVDAHCEGEATRVLVGGAPPVPGATMAAKRAWLQTEGDALRRTLLFEPRGHSTLSAVLLALAPASGADLGIVIMEGADYPPMSGTNTINTVTVALETGMLAMTEPETRLVVETPAGPVRVRAACRDGAVESVSFDNVPCFAVALGRPVEVEGVGTVTVDLAWGGHFFALVDAPSFGFSLVGEEAQELARLGERIKSAVAAHVQLAHPEQPGLLGELGFVTWTGPARAGGDGRNATIVSPGRLDRSPCGTATSARLAVLAARGELGPGRTWREESALSTTFTAEIVQETTVAGRPAIVPRITGRSWIHATTQITVDPDDPLPEGYTLSDVWGAGPTARF